MPWDYLLLRFVRRRLPSRLVHALLRRGWVLRPGLETRSPEEAVARYEALLQAHGRSWQGQRVFILGYGGYLGVAAELLHRGAAHVVLCDPYAQPDPRRNARLASQARYASFFHPHTHQPRAAYMSIWHEDVRALAQRRALQPVDVVLSTSVYEHLDDVEGITRALARLTKPQGIHIHFIDLRDHFFRYPFEMLTFSEQTWRRWLNPTSNLNRLRLPDYARVFRAHFAQVNIQVLARDLAAFRKVKPRIRPEFLTGDDEVDAVTHIVVVAQKPRPDAPAP